MSKQLKKEEPVRRVLVDKGGVDMVCEPIFGLLAWRCAACKRGVLHSWFRKCKVCKRHVRTEYATPAGDRDPTKD